MIKPTTRLLAGPKPSSTLAKRRTPGHVDLWRKGDCYVLTLPIVRCLSGRLETHAVVRQNENSSPQAFSDPVLLMPSGALKPLAVNSCLHDIWGVLGPRFLNQAPTLDRYGSRLPESGQTTARVCNTGASMIRIGFWGIFYHTYTKEPTKIVLVIILAPIVKSCLAETNRCCPTVRSSLPRAHLVHLGIQNPKVEEQRRRVGDGELK